jgi:hypothetical protein
MNIGQSQPEMMAVWGLDCGTCKKLKAFATDGQARHREAVQRLKRIAKSRR